MSDTVAVRALATLAGYAPPGGEARIGPGETVAGLAGRLGLPLGAIGTVLVNGRPARAETPLSPGDTVSFVPPITGG
ncbi:thiamine S protein [Solidesulfovibrio fructosivorans JJ]]|uniref:Thiamine S protein n=1 Tax=Solidesulfovibrio fructosivorans JJ] TaxID=596151 RepID=E1JZM3_SOLFR|nr:MoaD/ThiS family protein [Solidesulfovibrio fructosivorans]EFL50158.1 thiamine S protein [Solidesulfovibrio fructosivorans JJ]]